MASTASRQAAALAMFILCDSSPTPAPCLALPVTGMNLFGAHFLSLYVVIVIQAASTPCLTLGWRGVLQLPTPPTAVHHQPIGGSTVNILVGVDDGCAVRCGP